MSKFFLYYSGISSIVFIVASGIFFSIYGNFHGGLWAGAAGFPEFNEMTIITVDQCIHFTLGCLVINLQFETIPFKIIFYFSYYILEQKQS